MAEPLTLWQERCPSDWRIGGKTAQWGDRVERRWQVLTSLQAQGKVPVILLAESEPLDFLAGFIAACMTQSPVFLGNPQWTAAEWQQVFEQVQPDVMWGNVQRPLACTASPTQRYGGEQAVSPGWIMVPTGGSSGRIRFAIHTWETLTAAVVGFQQYFQVDRIHSCCVLPLYHVSGLMQFMRSWISRGKFAYFVSKHLVEQIDRVQLSFQPQPFFLSLVPTQLHRLLQQPQTAAWLSQFRTIFLGGAPAWTSLLDTAQALNIPLAPTYGMTETAAQIATLKPEDFWQGQTGSGLVLPHAQIQIRDETGAVLPAGQVGNITIQAKSLMLGYYPDRFTPSQWQPDDLGYLNAQGYLHIVGRNSQKIITGGEKVFPAEVEAAIRATHLVQDVCVVGVPDPDWGERVTALYVPQQSASIAELQSALGDRLAKFKQPKAWIALPELPRNAQGKINHPQLQCLITRQLVESGEG